MPITEDNFTGEELNAAVGKNPALLETVKGFMTKEKRFIVQDEAEHQTYLKKYEDDKIGQRVSEIALNIEKDVEAITGIKKESPNEKYYDYVKRVTKQLKDGSADLERQIGDLKGKTNLSDAERQRLSQLEKALTEKDEAINTLKTEKENELHALKVQNKMVDALAEIRKRYKKDLPQSLIALAEERAVAELTASARFQSDGALTFVKKVGDKEEVIVDPANSYKPKTAQKLLEESDRLKDLIDVGRQQEGTGSQGGGQNPSNKITVKKDDKGVTEVMWSGIPQGTETKVALGEWLKKQGVLDGSQEWNAIYDLDEVKKLRLR